MICQWVEITPAARAGWSAGQSTLLRGGCGGKPERCRPGAQAASHKQLPCVATHGQSVLPSMYAKILSLRCSGMGLL
jgi:hypothetical protein